LENIDNAGVKLSEFKGKVIVLNVWATWCVPCVPDLQRSRDGDDRTRRQDL
jgi:thiol-disulfide isomerase/thioredoxin